MTETPNGPRCKQEHELAAQKNDRIVAGLADLRKKIEGTSSRSTFPRGTARGASRAAVYCDLGPALRTALTTSKAFL